MESNPDTFKTQSLLGYLLAFTRNFGLKFIRYFKFYTKPTADCKNPISPSTAYSSCQRPKAKLNIENLNSGYQCPKKRIKN